MIKSEIELETMLLCHAAVMRLSCFGGKDYQMMQLSVFNIHIIVMEIVGKVSNNAKSDAKSDFLEFIDINSQPNGRSADSSSATHYLLPKFL